MADEDEVATSDTDSNWPTTAEGLTHTGDWYSSPDTQLQKMADLADILGVGIGITLVVPGGTISGTIIGGKQFFERTAEIFRSRLGDEKDGIGELFAKGTFDKSGELFDEEAKRVTKEFEDGKRDEPRWPLVRCIHLMDARFSAPGLNHIRLDNTRVLLSQVVAWSLGQIWVGES